ncbi:hypothetical protein DICVIV_07181, partial [Dictyocaulus viviparus]
EIVRYSKYPFKLEREKTRLEEEYAQNDRALRQKLERELSEKECALEITRKSLETRLLEIIMTKEQLDRIKAEFHVKFAADVETLNREWERVSGKKEELRAFYREEFEEEQQKLMRESIRLEKENATLKKKLADCEIELYELRSQLAALGNIQEDLKVANDRIRKEMEEKYQLSRCSYEVTRLKEENFLLKEELEQSRRLAGVSHPLKQKNCCKPLQEQYLTIIDELKMMSEKINSLLSERNYLRDLLLLAHKSIYRLRTDTTQLSNEINSKNNAIEEYSEHASLSSTPSSSGHDLQNIRKRFTALDELSKTLDTAIGCLNASSSLTERNFGKLSGSLIHEKYGKLCKSHKTDFTGNTSVKSSDKVDEKLQSGKTGCGNGNEIVSRHPSTTSEISESLTVKLKSRNKLNQKLRLPMTLLEEKTMSISNVENSKQVSHDDTEDVDHPRNQIVIEELKIDSENNIDEVESSVVSELDGVAIDKSPDSINEIEW